VICVSHSVAVELKIEKKYSVFPKIMFILAFVNTNILRAIEKG
jgi:hypothetical protein